MRRATLTPSTLLVTLLLVVTLAACGDDDETPAGDRASGPITSPLATQAATAADASRGAAEAPAVEGTTVVLPMTLRSPAFVEGQPIPARYTCDGEDISPLLLLENVPAETEGLTFVMHDPDAPGGDWVHWVTYDVPPVVRLAENVALNPIGVGGRNSWGRDGYGGPCPPSRTHRYVFRVYALDVELNLAPGATRETVETAMLGHVLAEAELTGTYSRQ